MLEKRQASRKRREKVSSRFFWNVTLTSVHRERTYYLWHEHINIFIIMCISFWIFFFASRALEESYNLEALFLIICVFLIDFFSGGISRGFQCFTWLWLLYLACCCFGNMSELYCDECTQKIERGGIEKKIIDWDVVCRSAFYILFNLCTKN